MKLSSLSYFIFEVNAAIDTGKYQHISITEVEEHIEKGDLVPYLKERLGKDVDLSLLDPVRAGELNAKLQAILGAYEGKERRKWGVENSGLCLLVAWTTEIIQQKDWD